MLPIVLDPGAVSLALIGRGETAVKRLDWLLAGGARDLAVYADAPTEAFAAAAGARLRRRLPTNAEIAAHHVVWVADLTPDEAAPLVAAARAAGTLINVEDVKPLCAFHNPSTVRRGDLLLTVSTGGKSPGLAVRIRRHLERTFGPEWADRLERLEAKRAAWKRRPRPLAELARLTDAVIDHKRWLP